MYRQRAFTWGNVIGRRVFDVKAITNPLSRSIKTENEIGDPDEDILSKVKGKSISHVMCSGCSSGGTKWR